MSLSLGIDFGGTTIKSGLVGNGKILRHGQPIETQKLNGPPAMIEALAGLIEHFRAESELTAVGIGLPGLVDSRRGIVHELTNVAGWVETPLRDILQERTGLTVTVENDAKAMAYGEWKHGAARDGHDIVCITLGTGVGGALILDGRLYRGAQLAAGEIGQMSIDYRGRPGPYGNFGGLEEYIGNVQIAQRAFERYQAAGSSRLLKDCSPRKLSISANEGDPIAKQMWEDIGDELGAALASVVWVINPDTIVIGGGVAKAGPLIFDPLIRSIRSRTLDIVNQSLRIVPAELGNDAGIIGNATLALEAVAK